MKNGIALGKAPIEWLKAWNEGRTAIWIATHMLGDRSRAREVAKVLASAHSVVTMLSAKRKGKIPDPR